MPRKAPGLSHREGLSIFKLTDMFPDEESARLWFEEVVWPDGRYCPQCGSVETHEAGHNNMPYRCRDCRSYFSVRTGTAIENSKLPLRKWVFAIYLDLTSLKGISSMKLHREIEVSQKTAWFMLHRIREGLLGSDDDGDPFASAVEADETFVGGYVKGGQGGRGKSIVAGVKERSSKQVRVRVVPDRKKPTLHGLITDNVDPTAQVYTDEAKSYRGIPNPHEWVNHSAGEYVREMAHTNGIEGFWSMLKRAYDGTYHKISKKHLQRYVDEFAGRHNMRDMDTVDQMARLVAGMVGRRLTRQELIADNGLPSGARGDKRTEDPSIRA